jgi:hypothetical protein
MAINTRLTGYHPEPVLSHKLFQPRSIFRLFSMLRHNTHQTMENKSSLVYCNFNRVCHVGYFVLDNEPRYSKGFDESYRKEVNAANIRF